MRRWFGSLSPERIEHVGLVLEMEGETYHHVKEFVDNLGVRDLRVEKYDNVRIDFEFTITYYNVIKQMHALLELLKDPQVTAVNLSEKYGSSILIADLIDSIRAVQRQLEELEL
jgi:hypothetical protein